MEEEEKVKVVVRCRPISNQEINQGHTNSVNSSAEDNSISIVNPAAKQVQVISELLSGRLCRSHSEHSSLMPCFHLIVIK